MLRGSLVVIVSVQDQFDCGCARCMRERIMIGVSEMKGHHRADEPTVDKRRCREETDDDLAAVCAHDPVDSACSIRTRQSAPDPVAVRRSERHAKTALVSLPQSLACP